MALALKFELRLEDRGGERVLVSALLAPEESVVRLDGVALQLFTRLGEPLGVRLLLPISGELHQAMLSTVELRCEHLPAGARVVGTAWLGAEQREATLPTDPFTELEAHVRGRRRREPDEDPTRLVSFASLDDLDLVEGAQRQRLAKEFPWIDEPRLARSAGELEVMENEQDVDDLVEGLGLDDESAEWLGELLREE